MTTAIPELTTSGPRKIPKAQRGEFKIDGETFHMLPPKQSILASASFALEQAGPVDDLKNMTTMLQFVWQLLAYVDDETVMVKDPDNPGKMKADGLRHGRVLLEYRLNDPRDSLDLEQVLEVFLKVLGIWSARPTKSPRGSTPSRQAGSAARGSRARTPSTRARR